MYKNSLREYVMADDLGVTQRGTYKSLAKDILRESHMQAIIETRVGDFVLSIVSPIDPLIVAQAAEVFKLKIDELTKGI
jgi:hypothetical protein